MTSSLDPTTQDKHKDISASNNTSSDDSFSGETGCSPYAYILALIVIGSALTLATNVVVWGPDACVGMC